MYFPAHSSFLQVLASDADSGDSITFTIAGKSAEMVFQYLSQRGKHKDLSTQESYSSLRPLSRGEYHFLG